MHLLSSLLSQEKANPRKAEAEGKSLDPCIPAHLALRMLPMCHTLSGRQPMEEQETLARGSGMLGKGPPCSVPQVCL